MNIVIIGSGYVGLVSGLCYASLGHQVSCVDIDPNKIAQLKSGNPRFFEPGLPELLAAMQRSGSVGFTDKLSEVLDGADIVMVAVGTPSTPTDQADLRAVFAVADQLGSCLRHAPLVVMKSTVPVGTGRLIQLRIREALVERKLEDVAVKVRVASCPEFLSEGTAIRNFQMPDRIVIGVQCDEDATILDQLHVGIDAPRIKMSVLSAELTKYAANAFLATKLSFINEVANLAEQTGASVGDVATAIGMDRRIGPDFLRAGVGYGGSCFPKDVSALRQISGLQGYEFKVLSAVIETNNRQRDRFFARVSHDIGGLKGRRIGIWGLAFKGGTDDVRDSAAIDIAQRMYGAGAEVVAYDPKAIENARRVLPDGIRFASSPAEAVAGADALLVLAEWPEFREAAFESLAMSMGTPKIFDGKNWLCGLDLWTRGFDYYAVGEPRGESE